MQIPLLNKFLKINLFSRTIRGEFYRRLLRWPQELLCIRPQDGAVRGDRFLTVGVFECDISHRRSVAVLCMLYKIMCNPVHPLNGALPGPCVPARVTRGALVAHRYTYAPPRCRTLQYSRTFIPFSVFLWNDLANPLFDGVGLAGFKSRANASL